MPKVTSQYAIGAQNFFTLLPVNDTHTRSTPIYTTPTEILARRSQTTLSRSQVKNWATCCLTARVLLNSECAMCARQRLCSARRQRGVGDVWRSAL